jgi:hypothetical protein
VERWLSGRLRLAMTDDPPCHVPSQVGGKAERKAVGTREPRRPLLDNVLAVAIICAMLDGRSATAAPQHVVARISSYDDLLAACRERVKALGVNYTLCDLRAGFTVGYLTKLLLHEQRNPTGKRRTRRGFTPQSFDAYLAALGLDLVAVENPEKVAALRRWQADNLLRREAPIRADATLPPITFSRHFMKRIASLGGQASAAKRRAIALEKKRRSLIYRANALRRWHRPSSD